MKSSGELKSKTSTSRICRLAWPKWAIFGSRYWPPRAGFVWKVCFMPLELAAPYLPMEAKPVEQIPTGHEWQYEPKWDGFRCLAFRDGDKIVLQSKSGQPLERYFPELVASLKKLKAKRFVLDGEIVVPISGRLSFDELLM